MTKITFQLTAIERGKKNGMEIPPDYDGYTIDIHNETIAEIIQYLRKCVFEEKSLTNAFKLTFSAHHGDIIFDNVLRCDYLTIRHGLGKRRKMAESYAVDLMHLHSITVKPEGMDFIICHHRKLHVVVTLPISPEEHSAIKEVGDYLCTININQQRNG